MRRYSSDQSRAAADIHRERTPKACTGHCGQPGRDLRPSELLEASEQAVRVLQRGCSGLEICIILLIWGEYSESISIHLPFLSQYFRKSMPPSWQKVACTPPICISMRLPLISRYFCRSMSQEVSEYTVWCTPSNESLNFRWIPS